MKEKLLNDLITFGKILRPKVHWANPAEIHFEMEKKLLDRSIKLLNIILPRGTAKSIIVGEEYPLYHIFMEELGQPKLVVLVSKTQAHSKNRLQAIKDTISYSTNFRAIFGNWGEYTAKSWRNDEIILKDGSAIITRGMGQPIRGLNYPGGIRPTLIVLDDPEDENNTKTQEAMENNLRWLLQGALPALDRRHGRCIVIGTPLHQRCIVETLAEMEEWTTIKGRFLIEENGHKRSLWEEVMTVSDLEKERDSMDAIGRVSIWYMERQCEVVGDEDQLFKSKYFKYYEGDYVYKDGNNYLKIGEDLKPINVFIGIDPASSVQQTADYSVIMVIGVDKDKNIYVLDYIRKRVTPLALSEKIITYFKRFHPTKVRIESVGYQEMLREYIRKKCEELNMYIPGLEIKENPRSSKSYRLESLEPLFASGKVYMKKSHTEFIDELLLYPRGKHDDTIDAFYYAQKRSFPPFHSERTSVEKVKVKKKKKNWFLV